MVACLIPIVFEVWGELTCGRREERVRAEAWRPQRESEWGAVREERGPGCWGRTGWPREEGGLLSV